MALEFWWAGVPGFLAAALAFAMAFLVRKAGPGVAANQQLSWLLVFEGVFVLGSFARVLVTHEYPLKGTDLWAQRELGLGLTGRPVLEGLWILGAAALAVLPWLYLMLLSNLDTPFMRVLRRPRATGVLVVLAGFFVVVGVTAAAYMTNYETGGVYLYPPLGFMPSEEIFGAFAIAASLFFVLMMFAVSLLGLVVAIRAYRRAPRDSVARARAKSFAIAFGTRDTLYFLAFLPIPLAFLTQSKGLDEWSLGPAMQAVGNGADFFEGIWQMAFPLILLVYIPLIVYGILRSQLFDIDLRIKIAIHNSTIGGIFAVAFFVGSKYLNTLVPVDGFVLGTASAGAIALAIRPIKKATMRLVNIAMPNVTDSPEYLAMRRMDVYRGSLEAAYADRVVSPAERALLEKARAKLGLTEQTAQWLEEQVRAYSHLTGGKFTPPPARKQPF